MMVGWWSAGLSNISAVMTNSIFLEEALLKLASVSAATKAITLSNFFLSRI